MVVEKAYLIESLKDLEKLPKDANRVYVGSEYCIKTLPEDFENIVIECAKSYPVSFLTPPLLESDLPIFFKYFEKLKKILQKPFEVIANDWGILYWLSKNVNVGDIIICTGRLLSYQKRGFQELNNKIEMKNLQEVPILDELMQEFLIKLRVSLIEIDIEPYGAILPEKVNIPISVHLSPPFASYTLNCPFTFDGKLWQRSCKRQCLTGFLQFYNKETKSPILQKGKIYYTLTGSDKKVKAQRLVHILWKKAAIKML